MFMDLCSDVGEVISVLLHELRCEKEKEEEEGRESGRERERGEELFAKGRLFRRHLGLAIWISIKLNTLLDICQGPF